MSAVKKKIFRTQFQRIPVKSCSGSRYEVSYKPHISDTGALELEVSGKIDVYEQIQSFRESCDINVLLQRFANGDMSALSQGLPYFADVTEMPTTLAGFLQLYADAEDAFSKFPADLRGLFNNSANEFFASLDTDEFNKRMGDYVASRNAVVSNVDKEVVVDEQKSE